jgi:hypothetical protein
MSDVDPKTIAWTKTYKALLADFIKALGGENITPARRAIARNVATLQTELNMLTHRFAANGRGASTEDLAEFLKVSAMATSMMESVGLARPCEPIPDKYDEAADKAALLRAFDAVMRQNEQADTSDHVAGCRCVACEYKRERATVPASDPGNSIVEAQEAPAIVRAAAAPPALRVVKPSALGRDSAASNDPAPPSLPLTEQRSALSARRDGLVRQVSDLAEAALVDPDIRAKRDRLQADLNVLDHDLHALNAEIAKQPSDATRLFFESGGNSGRSQYDMSPAPDWPKLIG